MNIGKTVQIDRDLFTLIFYCFCNGEPKDRIQEKIDLIVEGLFDKVHKWNKRALYCTLKSDPDPDKRDQARQRLEELVESGAWFEGKV